MKVRFRNMLESFVRCEKQHWPDCGGPSNTFPGEGQEGAGRSKAQIHGQRARTGQGQGGQGGQGGPGRARGRGAKERNCRKKHTLDQPEAPWSLHTLRRGGPGAPALGPWGYPAENAGGGQVDFRHSSKGLSAAPLL